MANKMKDFLPKIEMEKMQAMLELEEKYETGQLSLEEAREQMKTKVGKIRPYHLAFIEQNMKSREDDECIRADMRKIIELVEGFMDYSRPDVPEDHPLSHIIKRTMRWRRLLLAVEDLIRIRCKKKPVVRTLRPDTSVSYPLPTQAEPTLSSLGEEGLRPPQRRCGTLTTSSVMKSRSRCDS